MRSLLSKPSRFGLESLEPRQLLAAAVSAPALFVDLALSFGNIRLPAPLIPGEKGRVPIRVSNLGNTTAKGPLDLTLYLSTDQTLDASDIQVGNLHGKNFNIAAGKSKNIDLRATLPLDTPEGTYYLIVHLDQLPPTSARSAASFTADSNPSNDTAVSAASYLVQADQDLAIKTQDVVGFAGGTRFFPGDSITVNAKITNTGGEIASGTATVNVYLSTNGTLNNATLLASSPVTLSNLAVNASTTVQISATIPSNIAAGKYALLTQLVPGTVGDINAGNDTSHTNLKLQQPGPDLQASGIGLSNFDSLILPGDFGQVSVNVVNSGSVPLSGNVPLNIFIVPGVLRSADSDWFLFVSFGFSSSLQPTPVGAIPIQIGSGSMTLNNLDRGQSAVSNPISVTLPANLATGVYSIFASVDPNNTLGQTNTSNDRTPAAVISVGQQNSLSGGITWFFAWSG